MQNLTKIKLLKIISQIQVQYLRVGTLFISSIIQDRVKTVPESKGSCKTPNLFAFTSEFVIASKHLSFIKQSR